MANLFGALGKSLEDWAYNTFYSDTQKKNDAAVKASNQQAQAHAQMKAGQINPVQYKRQAAIAANSIAPAYSAPAPQQQGYAPQAPSRPQIQAPRISDIPRPQLNPTQQFDKIIQPKPTIKPPVPQNNSSVGFLGGVAHDMFYGSQKRDLEKSQNATNMQAEAHKAYKEGKISKQQYGSILRQAADSANNTTARSRIAPELKKGLSYKDIAQNSGYSTEEVKDYVKKYNPSYGDRGLAMNALGGVKDFGVNMLNAGAGIVTKPIHEATANRAADNDKLKQINADFKAGNITGAAAMERAQAIADPYINKKVNVSDDGTIGVGSGNALDFLGKFTMQGVDTASVLPVGGAFAKGAGVGLQQVGKSVAGPTLSTALTRTGNMANAVGNNLMQTTINQTSSKIAEQLATRGMNIDKARIIGNALTNNAKEAGIYGTLQTGSDIAQGNFTPEGALMNYGGQFALGAVGELGLGAAGTALGKGIRTAPTPERVVKEHPEIQGLETTAKQYFDHRNSLIDRGLSPNSTAVRAVDNAIRKLGKEYDKTYKRLYEMQTSGGSVPAGMFDPTGGKLGKQPDVPKEDLIIKNGEGKAMSIDPLESLKQEARKLDEQVRSYDMKKNFKGFRESDEARKLVELESKLQESNKTISRLDNPVDKVTVSQIENMGRKAILEGNVSKADLIKQFNKMGKEKFPSNQKRYIDDVYGSVEAYYDDVIAKGNAGVVENFSQVAGVPTSPQFEDFYKRTVLEGVKNGATTNSNAVSGNVAGNTPRSTTSPNTANDTGAKFVTGSKGTVAHTQPTPKVEAPTVDPTTALKQEALSPEAMKVYVAAKNMPDAQVTDTLRGLTGYENTPAHQALQRIANERKLGGIETSHMVVGSKEWSDAQAKLAAQREAASAPTPKAATMQEGRTNKALDGQIRYNGTVMDKRQYIDALVKDGYAPQVKKINGKDRYVMEHSTRKGDYYVVTKTEHDLAKSTAAPKVEAPQPTAALKQEGKAMSVEPKQSKRAYDPDDQNYWATPIKGEPKGKMPDVTDVNGVTPKEGDTIKFSSILGDDNGKAKSGTATIRWQEPTIANASGKRIEGKWIGNGLLENGHPFEIVKRADGSTPQAPKPTLQDALAGKSTKIKDQTTSTPVAKTPVETSQSQVSKTTQTPQAVAPEQSASVSSPTNVLQKEATQKTRGKTGLIKQESQELSRTYPDNTTKQVKKRGFTETVKGSDEVSSEVRKKVSGEYNVRSTDKLAVSANKFAKGNLNKISDDVNSRLDKKLGTINDQDVADALAVAKRLDGQSRFNESQAIYDKLAEHGTKGGQTIQAFSLLRNRTPEGVKFQMLKNLKKAGVVLTKEDQKQVSKLIDNVRKTKVGTESRDRALYETLDFVSRRIPTSNPDKLVNFWRAGLLTAPKTTAGNLLGNSTELATQKFWSDPIAVGTDKFFSMFTGKRTKTYGTGTVSGVKEGVVKGADYLKTGFDVRNMPNAKYDAPRRVNYKNKLLDTYVNGVYRWMGAQDQPFYYAAKASAAHDLAKADGINLKLKGEELANYIEKSVANPEWKPQTFKTAKDVTDYAKYAVYQNETMLGSMASGLKQGADKFKGGRAITDFILPFTQVPSSIAMRIIDRTPVGIARTVVSQIKNKTFDQRAMAEAIGNGSFGIPVIAAGYALANSGNITGAYPSDEKERKLWEAEGKQAYSVKVGDRWYSLNYMQPFGTLMSIGKQVSDDKKDGKSDAEAWMNATGAAAKSIESQSFLKGLNGVLSAINDPERSMGQFVKSTASSVVPNFIRAGATATDSMQRETKTPLDAFMGAVPGVRQTLPTKLDMFGADLKAKDNAVNQFVNPLSPSKVKGQDDSVLQELRRLQDAKEGIVTTTFDKTSIGGAELTPDQVRNLNQLVNTEVKEKWSKVMQDQRYKDMSDSEKSAALKRAKENIAESVKKQFVFDNKITTTSTYKDKANKSVFTGSKGGDSGETYQEKYDYAVDDFKKNSGSLSPIERAKKQKNIAYLSVQKDYDKDTVSLYGMGESDIYGLLDNLPEKESSQYFNMILKYGDALVEKGLLKTNKLRDRYGNVQYVRGSGGKVSYTTGGRSSGGRKASTGRKSSGGGGGRSGGDVTSGKALLALQTGLNKIKTPRTTGKTPMPKSSVPVPPSFNKKNLRKFAVKSATLTAKKARA